MTTQELFFKLLRYKSLTPKDDGAFLFIANYLSHFEHKIIDVADTKNIFIYKKFGDGPHLCFGGHIDVVPAGDGWNSDPFEPKVIDQKVYARGAQDMKSGLCAFLHACKQTTDFPGTLSLLLTSDEEGDGTHGSIEVLRYLELENMLPDAAIIAEPTCESIFGDTIKIGRRGSINGVLRINGLQGHAAYPQKAKNPVNMIAPILAQITGHHFDSGDDFFAPSELVVTDIRAGIETTNVTPGVLKMMFNVRNSPNTGADDIKSYLQSLLQNLDYTLTLSQSAEPFATDSNSYIVQLLQESITKVCNLSPKLSSAGGTSDARFFAAFGVKAVEFGVTNDTIHAPNERCSIDEVEKLEKVFLYVIQNFKG